MDLVMIMISYKPFYETLFKKGITEYNLIFKQGFSANTFLALMKQAVMLEGSRGKKLRVVSRNERSLQPITCKDIQLTSSRKMRPSVLQPQEMNYGSDQN